MGQCMSRKAAGAFAASSAAAHNRPTAMPKHRQLKESPDDEKESSTKKSSAPSKGVAMSFGFKRRQNAPSIASNSAAARRLASVEIIDRNGNRNGDTEREPLTSNAVPTGRTTPRLAPPKKEASATRVSRFGFRQPHVNRLNKVADLNNIHEPTQFSNNNHDKHLEFTSVNLLQPKIKTTTGTVIIDSNRNRPSKTSVPQPQVTKFTLQTNQLPRPQFPLRVMESKTAKTIANTNRKICGTVLNSSAESDSHSSSKEGSVTEDSGVGSHVGNFETDTLQSVEILDSSPSFNSRKPINVKHRNLEVVVSGNKFDVRDLDENSEPAVSLPSLPSAFVSNTITTGLVRERTLEYQRHIERERRKISVTSSEGYSDDNGEEKTHKDTYKNEKHPLKNSPHKIFLKCRPLPKDDSSPASSDEWAAGEAMADEFSCSLSSSDESKEKEISPMPLRVTPLTIGSTLKNLMNIPVATPPKTEVKEVKSVLLTMEDPQFAAVAAASNTGSLLEDETSPVDSLLCSYSESNDICKKKLHQSSSNSKDINEKLTLSNTSSPGTPTNADNSLSLSDGKDYFDDEIADQPALVFDDTITGGNNSETYSIVHQKSESTPTLIETTPKVRRKMMGSIEGSPMSLKNRKFLNSRTGSVDTLSPCESIASDDLMMDFEYIQSSGVDEIIDRTEIHSSGLYGSLDVKQSDIDVRRNDLMRDWSTLLANVDKASPRSLARNNRLLRSRAATPNSVPDSPRSLDSRINVKSRTSLNQSPLRPPRTGSITSSAGYESDDSIKLERSNHGAMVQDIMSIKTMLLKLKRVLHESETHNPFDTQHNNLVNGLFNGLSSSAEDNTNEETNAKIELADLRRQVLFLQGQIEDRDKTVQSLQEQMTKLINADYTAKSAPASTAAAETCNAATQTERLRPISAGPSLLQGCPSDGNMGSLVSVNEGSTRKSRTHTLVDTATLPNSNNTKKSQPRLWRKPGEPPSPQRYSTNTSIPRRANSRTRAPSIPS